MTRSRCALALAALVLGSAPAFAGQIVDIDGTTSTGTTVQLDAGTYTVTYAGKAGGGAYDGYSLAVSGTTPVRFTDELSITLGSATNFAASPTYDYIVGGVQQDYSTASAALAAYQNALASGTLNESSSYAPQNYTGMVSQISFTLASAGPVTFTAPDLYIFNTPPNYVDNSGGVSIMLTKTASPVPEPATLAVLGMGLLGLGFVRRRQG